MVQKSTVGALGSQYWYSRVLQEQSVDCVDQQSTIGTLGCCVGTSEYYRSTREAAGTKGTIGKWEGCACIAEYYRSTGEAVIVHQIATGVIGKLCWYREYYRSALEAVLVQKSIIGALGRLCWYRRVL